MTPDRNQPGELRWALLLVRYALPAMLTVAGILGIVIGHGSASAAGAGVVLLGVALMVVLINWLFRLSVASNADRDREEEAREYLSRHGHWPGEGGASEPGSTDHHREPR